MPRSRAALTDVLLMTQPSPYPETRREDVVEEKFGVQVFDPYRWLEKSNDAEVDAWVAAQNSHMRGVIDRISARGALEKRLEELLTIGEVSSPWVRRTTKGMRYFYTQRKGAQNQPVLVVRDGTKGAARVLFDPNQEDEKKLLALDWYTPSWEGDLVAYGTSEGGSEESTLRVLDVNSGKDLPDTISRARYSSVCFLPGQKRFYYSRFPAPSSVPKGEEKYHRRIYEHVLGRNPDADPMVFASKTMTDFPSCTISSNGRWLVVRVHQGWSQSAVYIADTSAKKLDFVEVTSGKKHVYDPLVTNDTLWMRSNEGASRYVVFAVDPKTPGRENWKTVIPEHATDVLSDFNVVAGQLVVHYMAGGATRIDRHELGGRRIDSVALPGVGTSNGSSGLADGDEFFFDFESVGTAPIIFRSHKGSSQPTEFARVKAPFAADAFVAEPSSTKSSDGTTVPYLLVHHRDVDPKQGPHPTLLYGYGGFNVSLQPRFSRTLIAWLEAGGVYVQANLRGGGELGEAWHRAGQLDKKQNVFDDFYAVAQSLIAKEIATRSTLAAHGRSNGGLLAAAATTQRPDLFRAVVSSVPLTDMLRFDRFLIAKLWESEYGSPSNAEHFRWLRAYSPYHNVQSGTAYPAVLLTTAEGDTRVDPMHARKMAAALQHASASGKPVLLRTETEAGHGQGKPTRMIAEEQADIFAFLLWQLGQASSD